jgi:hypothetical protein
VLDLAPDDEAYLAGRRKQALRTNLRHARQQGLQANLVETYDEWLAAAREVLRHRQDGSEVLGQMGPPPDSQPVAYYVATVPGGRPVAYGITAIFNDCAVLARMLSAPTDPASSSARYLLHTFMRSDLRDRGVRNLIVGTAIRETPGLQYFQYLLGYEVRNLQITVRSRLAQGLLDGLATDLGPNPALGAGDRHLPDQLAGPDLVDDALDALDVRLPQLSNL